MRKLSLIILLVGLIVILIPTPIAASSPMVIYRQIPHHDWQSVEQFTKWYHAQGFTILFNPPPRSDCDDYAEWVRWKALNQGYSISDALTYYGRYYGKKVTEKYTSEQSGHVGCIILIQGTYYYFEPMVNDFNGLIRIVDRD